MKKFLFITYKSDSVDYCRGCVMDRYSSDFVIQNNLDREELIKLWSEYLYKNLNLGISEDEYQFHIFNSGVRVFELTYSYCDNSADNLSEEEEKALLLLAAGLTMKAEEIRDLIKEIEC